jgi:hypothetical protein
VVGLSLNPPLLMLVAGILFLLPHAIFGMAFLFGLMMLVMEPLKNTWWRFSADSVECHVSILGIRRRWRYVVPSGYAEVEIRNDSRPQRKSPSSDNGASVVDCREYGALIVDRNRDEICTVDNLTLGEALWFRHRLLSRRPQWFSEPARAPLVGS